MAKEINRLAIIHTVQTCGSISQADLSRLTGLSAPCVLRITRELMAEGLVLEDGRGQSKGGRKPVLLRFNPSSGYVVGVDLGGSHMVGAIADFSGCLVRVVNTRTPANEDPKAVIEALCETIERLLSDGSVARNRVRAIGVGAPGVTRTEVGFVVHAPAVGWRNVPLRSILEERFKIPAFVENDANMIALGELWFGAAQGASNVVCIVVGTGIGAGIVIDGQLYRGSHDAAGEVGFTIFDEGYLGVPYREFGCLETFAAGPGIARRARQLVEQGQGRGILTLAGAPEAISSEHVFEAARRGDPQAMELVNQTADALAIGVINIGALLDPDVVVLGGGVMGSGELLLDRIQSRLQDALVSPPRVVLSALGGEATVKGAIARALASSRAHHPPSGHRLVWQVASGEALTMHVTVRGKRRWADGGRDSRDRYPGSVVTQD